MRKAFKPIVLITIILILGFQFTFTTFVPATKIFSPDTPYQPPEQSREELYQDIFISLLMPYIENEIDRYYSKYLTQPPMIAPYMVYVASAERPNGYRTFVFRLKLIVYSYIGPHFPVGLDYVTFTVDGSGNVKMEKFEHIKSYTLPSRYEDIIREGYRNPIP